jgi:hypothetical protein
MSRDPPKVSGPPIREKHMSSNRRECKKVVDYPSVWKGDGWNVVSGQLKRKAGNPGRDSHLFKYVAEKLPFESLSEVKKLLEDREVKCEGVYMAHDSFGVPRYGGRGQIFVRLASHKKNHRKELLYFSFYIIETKKHEREIETAIIRAAASQMLLNTRKVPTGIKHGDVKDYEPGCKFFERQDIRGKRKPMARKGI